jgi:hypothetical protein
MNLNSGDSSASVLTLLLSSEYPTTELTWLAWGPHCVASGKTQQKHHFQQFLHYCYGQLPSYSPDIIDVFTGRCQAMHVASRKVSDDGLGKGDSSFFPKVSEGGLGKKLESSLDY